MIKAESTGIVLILLAIGLISPFAVARADEEWFAFRDPNGAFTAEIPGTPTVERSTTKAQDGTDVVTVQYQVGNDTIVMMISDTDMAKFKSDAGKAIDGAVGAIKNMDSQLLSDTIATLDGQVGREVELVDKDGDKVTDRIFFVGGHLYQTLIVVGPKADNTSVVETRRFLTTFHFSAH